MPIADALLVELDQEIRTTRRVLERVPETRLSWRPHPKSMSLGQLALHVAQVPGSVVRIAQADLTTPPEFLQAEAGGRARTQWWRWTPRAMPAAPGERGALAHAPVVLEVQSPVMARGAPPAAASDCLLNRLRGLSSTAGTGRVGRVHAAGLPIPPPRRKADAARRCDGIRARTARTASTRISVRLNACTALRPPPKAA
jgi:hypothetical protein